MSDWSSDVCSSDLNYMIDLPSGATGRIANNLFVQGRDKENYSAIIAVAAEERKHPSRGLVIEGNRARLPEDMGRKSAFVADWRSEEHTSELQSLMRISYAVFCLKKKKS